MLQVFENVYQSGPSTTLHGFAYLTSMRRRCQTDRPGALMPSWATFERQLRDVPVFESSHYGVY